MKQTQDSFRKAAVLIDSLDRHSADALLDQMDEQQASRIRQAVLELDNVSPAERRQVMSAFLASQKPRSSRVARDVVTDDGGIEIEASLAARLSEDHHERTDPAAGRIEKHSPFQLLQEADAGLIARFLDRENPQAAAVVLAHLPPERSAEILARLTPDRQTDVVRRIVHMSETPPEVLLDVEHEIGSKLSEQLMKANRRQEGLAAIRRILAAADAPLRNIMLENVATADASLSDQLSTSPTDDMPATKPRPSWMRKPVGRSSETPSPPSPREDREERAGRGQQGFSGRRLGESTLPSPAATAPDPPGGRVQANKSPQDAMPNVSADGTRPASERKQEPPSVRFDDVARLPDAALATLMAEVDTDVTVLALTAADPKFVQRVLKQLPRRDAKRLARQLAHPVPMRLNEIERAQQEMADVAQELALLTDNRSNKEPERLAAVA